MTKRTVKRKPSQKPKRSVHFSLVDRGAGRVPQGFGNIRNQPVRERHSNRNVFRTETSAHARAKLWKPCQLYNCYMIVLENK